MHELHFSKCNFQIIITFLWEEIERSASKKEQKEMELIVYMRRRLVGIRSKYFEQVLPTIKIDNKKIL